MATSFDKRDQAAADAFEAALKDASITGITVTGTEYTKPVMTTADYAPSIAGVDANMPRDVNRDTGAAMSRMMRTVPVSLPVMTVANPGLPAAQDYVGCIVYVPDAPGGAVVAFSDGGHWRRLDNLATVV